MFLSFSIALAYSNLIIIFSLVPSDQDIVDLLTIRGISVLSESCKGKKARLCLYF